MLGAPRNDAVEMRVPAAIPYQPECSKRKRHAHVFGRLALLVVLVGPGGCGASLSDAQAREQRSKLRALLGEPVASREQRDQHSRTMVEVADSGALNGLNQEQLRAAIGRGIACRAEICSQNGFRESDWYYEVGVAQSEEIKQLPVLIIGFDPRGRAARIWTLKTH
jgi:hypothetical protein